MQESLPNNKILRHWISNFRILKKLYENTKHYSVYKFTENLLILKVIELLVHFMIRNFKIPPNNSKFPIIYLQIHNQNNNIIDTKSDVLKSINLKLNLLTLIML